MPDLSGLPALDVAIGLFALFFLLSVVLSAVNEGIANVLGWRAKTLEDAIRNMVGDRPVEQGLRHLIKGGWKRFGRVSKPPAAITDKESQQSPDIGDLTSELFAHWRVRALVRDPEATTRRRARPSYLPPRAFSLALAEIVAAKAPVPTTGESAWQRTDEQILKHVNAALKNLPPQLGELAGKAASNAHKTLEGFRVQVERAFDDSMERASGWYKRKVQTMLLVLSVVVVIGMNVDTVRVATSLLNDEPLRSAVAARAAAEGEPKDAAEAIDDISQLKLPVGWGDNAPDNVIAAIPGWLVTIAALSLGAPFWFDLLSRFARLRGSGVPESPRSLSDTAGTIQEERVARDRRAADRMAATGSSPGEDGEQPPPSGEDDGPNAPERSQQ